MPKSNTPVPRITAEHRTLSLRFDSRHCLGAYTGGVIALLTSLIGQRVADARKVRDWSQIDLARRSGVSASYISRLENGEYQRPSHEKLSAIASALGQRVADLTDPPDQKEDSERRRMIESHVGPENADLAEAILEKMRGKPRDDLKTVLNVVEVLLSGMQGNRNG